MTFFPSLFVCFLLGGTLGPLFDRGPLHAQVTMAWELTWSWLSLFEPVQVCPQIEFGECISRFSILEDLQ